MKNKQMLKRSMTVFAAAGLLYGSMIDGTSATEAAAKKGEAPKLQNTAPKPPVISLDKVMTKSVKASLEKLYQAVPAMKGREIKALHASNGLVSLQLNVKGGKDYAIVTFQQSTGVIKKYDWFAHMNPAYKSDKALDSATAREKADAFLEHMFGDWADGYGASPQVKGVKSDVIFDKKGKSLKSITTSTVNYYQLVDGAINQNDRLSVQVDGEGRILSYSHTVIIEK